MPPDAVTSVACTNGDASDSTAADSIGSIIQRSIHACRLQPSSQQRECAPREALPVLHVPAVHEPAISPEARTVRPGSRLWNRVCVWESLRDPRHSDQRVCVLEMTLRPDQAQ